MYDFLQMLLFNDYNTENLLFSSPNSTFTEQKPAVFLKYKIEKKGKIDLLYSVAVPYSIIKAYYIKCLPKQPPNVNQICLEKYVQTPPFSVHFFYKYIARK